MDQECYDVCVVGAGIMGSATARHLAKLGKNTLLLDQFPLPHWRGSSHGQTRIIRCTYDEPYYCKMATDALKMWKEIEEQAGEKILHENIGMLQVEQQPGENLNIAKEHLSANNVEFQALSSKSLKEKYPETQYGPEYSAILERSAGILMADKCLKNLQTQFIGCGGILRDNNQVITIQPDSNGVTIVTNQSSYRSRKVVLTAGPWINKLLKPLGTQLQIKPCQAPVCYWKITKPGAYDVSTFPTFYDASKADGRHIYGLPSLEYPGLIKMGPTGETQTLASFTPPTDADMRDSNRTNLEAFIATTSDYIKNHFPHVEYRQPAIVEMCIYTLTPGRNFIIDKHPSYNNVIIAAGFSGHGFKHAPVVGKILSELALDQISSYDISHFRISKFIQQTPKSSL